MAKRTCPCGVEIPAARLAALPKATTCVTCSTTERVKGNMQWDGKHTPVLEVVEPGRYAPGRQGFHASLPFNSAKNHRLATSMNNVDLSLQAPVIPVPVEEVDVVRSNVPRATCHPDRPRATPQGHCLECAMGWYQRRLG